MRIEITPEDKEKASEVVSYIGAATVGGINLGIGAGVIPAVIVGGVVYQAVKTAANKLGLTQEETFAQKQWSKYKTWRASRSQNENENP